MSLSGAIRPVGHAALRLREAQKLGFAAAVMPAAREATPQEAGPSLPPLGLTRIRHLAELDAEILRPQAGQKRQRYTEEA